MRLFSVLFVFMLNFIVQGCDRGCSPVCNCDTSDLVIEFIDKEGEIFYLNNPNMQGWIITVQSTGSSQILAGKICNTNSIEPFISNIIDPSSPTNVIFSGTVTQLCPNETTPVHPSNISYYYIKIDNIKLN